VAEKEACSGLPPQQNEEIQKIWEIMDFEAVRTREQPAGNQR
jgi:hypothetical protein